MLSGQQMVAEVYGHRGAVVGDKGKLVFLTPAENFWIERTKGGGGRLTDAAYNQFGFASAQAITQSEGDMFIQQKLNRFHTASG